MTASTKKTDAVLLKRKPKKSGIKNTKKEKKFLTDLQIIRRNDKSKLSRYIKRKQNRAGPSENQLLHKDKQSE